MAIRFIRDYVVRGSSPIESYRQDQLVDTMSEASEQHFVSRGLAVFDAAARQSTDAGPARDVPAPTDGNSLNKSSGRARAKRKSG
ncbi:MAG: hypothetical protein CMN73_04325 [Sphingomonas sp.]|nr:hypothetical protein [Sphingomonas sp.]|tara:strand:- start:51 stop:305 length:255 start_codon:yes stop_codon:yes gene_type:complete